MLARPTTLGFGTRAVHAGTAPDPATGARAVPIYQTNGFVFDDIEHGADIFALRRPGFAYSRGSNPTTAALERRVADLEGGTAAIAVASGQSAWMLALLTLCASGEAYIGSNRLFGGSLALMRRMDERLGIRCLWAEPTPEAIAAAIRPEARAIIIESVVNPSGDVADLPAIAAVAKRAGLPLIVDNTLASPALLQPIAHGADIVLHSASKFFAGHGQAIGGVIVDGGTFPFAGDARFPLIARPWADYDDILLTDAFPTAPFAAACRLTGLREYGPGMSPFVAFLMLTGIETLPLRMERHCSNALAVARFLAAHPAVAAVSHPLLAGANEVQRIARLMPNGVGSIFAATLKGGEEAARAFVGRLKLFSHLVNIGEARSLVAHPATTTHRTLGEADRARLGISAGTVRLSIGIEDPDDLIDDLGQALAG